jgi:hypothetical protein
MATSPSLRDAETAGVVACRLVLLGGAAVVVVSASCLAATSNDNEDISKFEPVEKHSGKKIYF